MNNGYNKEKFVLLLKKIKKQNAGEAIKRLQAEVRRSKQMFGEVDLDVTFSAAISDIFDVKTEESREELVNALAVLLEENKDKSELILIKD